MDTREFSIYFMDDIGLVDGVDGVIDWINKHPVINLVNEEVLREHLEMMKVQQRYLYGITGICHVKRTK